MARKAVVVVAAVAVAVIIGAAASAATGQWTVTDTGMAAQDGADALAYQDRVYGGIETGNGSPLKGEPSAPITIIEFGDYQCHFCELWHHQTLPRVTADYIESGAVNLIFVDYAFLGRDSPKAAQASYCAGDQEMYWEYHDKLYESQQSRIDGGWASAGNLRIFATEIGLDMDEFDDCMAANKYAERVSFNTRVGAANGVEATPTFFVLGPNSESVMISGAQPYGVFIRAIDSLG